MNKGRNKRLILMRDEAIRHRYRYLTDIRRMKFEDTLHHLSEYEFYLSQERIMDILKNEKTNEKKEKTPKQ